MCPFCCRKPSRRRVRLPAPDVVAVAGMHDPRPGGRVSNTEEVAHHVRPDAVAPWLNPLSHQFLDIVFVAGWARGFHQPPEKAFAVAVHCAGPRWLKTRRAERP